MSCDFLRNQGWFHRHIMSVKKMSIFNGVKVSPCNLNVITVSIEYSPWKMLQSFRNGSKWQQHSQLRHWKQWVMSHVDLWKDLFEASAQVHIVLLSWQVLKLQNKGLYWACLRESKFCKLTVSVNQATYSQNTALSKSENRYQETLHKNWCCNFF